MVSAAPFGGETCTPIVTESQAKLIEQINADVFKRRIDEEYRRTGRVVFSDHEARIRGLYDGCTVEIDGEWVRIEVEPAICADLDQRDRFPDLVFKREEWSYGPPMPGNIDEDGKRMISDAENERVMRAIRDASRGNG